MKDDIANYINAIQAVNVTDTLKAKIISLVDYTSLNDSDTRESLLTFLPNAKTTLGNVAAVCIYPAFVKLAADELADTSIHIATVANFPSGYASLESTLAEINQSLTDGANEIDVVLPYRAFLANEITFAHDYIATCKAACGDEAILKVILETGELATPESIHYAARLAVDAGADFLKTSTGKVSINATLESAAILLRVIKATTNKEVGLKVAGGIRDWDQAIAYVQLAELMMGKEWVTPAHFRIGASKLLSGV